MASKVFLHIGLPKTGTTYLQTVMWSDRARMRAQGVLLPGRERRDHLWATRVIRQDPNLATYDAAVRESWDVLRAEIAAWSGTAVISHEFFAGCSPEQAAGMIAALQGPDGGAAEVHLVVTAREPVGLYAGSWQESLKNRDTRTMPEYAAAPVSDNPMAVWNWRTLDVGLVLERWAATLPAAHVHVLPLPPPGSPRDLLWTRFATLVGLDPASFDLSATFPNESMGLAEAETLRRVNAHLQDDDFQAPFDRGVYIRTFLADERLVTRGGEKYWPTDDTLLECRARADAAIATIRVNGYDVVGDVEDLRVPDVLAPRRPVDSVTEAEVAEVATAVIGHMLHDVRRLTRERNGLERELEALRAENPVPGLREAIATRFPWARRIVRR
ncbi:hypothetical protein [Marmoricola sp. RAF53]|uniref:hypothetical protein n=1 Tax=Marmoricola sp. RAF53 TaxID=3233059 RepID=UPI003F9CA145